MKISRFASLKTRLYVLVLITALPGWALVTYNASEQKLAAVRAILAAERLRRERLTGLEGFVQGLLATL